MKFKKIARSFFSRKWLIILYLQIRYNFCKQWKGISFPACWGVPQTPGPTKMYGPNTMRGMVACASKRTLLCRRHSKKPEAVSRVNTCASRTPDPAPGFRFWADKAANPQSGFTGPVPDWFLSLDGSPVPAQSSTARPHWPLPSAIPGSLSGAAYNLRRRPFS